MYNGRKWYGSPGSRRMGTAGGVGMALSMNHYHHHYGARGDDFGSNRIASNLVFLLVFGFLFFMAQFIIVSRLNPDSLVNPKHHKSKYSAVENMNTGGREFLIEKHMKDHEETIQRRRRLRDHHEEVKSKTENNNNDARTIELEKREQIPEAGETDPKLSQEEGSKTVKEAKSDNQEKDEDTQTKDVKNLNDKDKETGPKDNAKTDEIQRFKGSAESLSDNEKIEVKVEDSSLEGSKVNVPSLDSEKEGENNLQPGSQISKKEAESSGKNDNLKAQNVDGSQEGTKNEAEKAEEISLESVSEKTSNEDKDVNVAVENEQREVKYGKDSSNDAKADEVETRDQNEVGSKESSSELSSEDSQENQSVSEKTKTEVVSEKSKLPEKKESENDIEDHVKLEAKADGVDENEVDASELTDEQKIAVKRSADLVSSEAEEIPNTAAISDDRLNLKGSLRNKRPIKTAEKTRRDKVKHSAEEM